VPPHCGTAFTPSGMGEAGVIGGSTLRWTAMRGELTRMPSGGVVGGERPRQARDRGLGGVVLQVAAACDDGTYGGDVNDRSALVAAHQRNRRLGTPFKPSRACCRARECSYNHAGRRERSGT